jgi:hypothetical protein
MIQLVISDHEVLKFDDQTGQTWVLKEDDDENPVWVVIKDAVEKKEN